MPRTLLCLAAILAVCPYALAADAASQKLKLATLRVQIKERPDDIGLREKVIDLARAMEQKPQEPDEVDELKGLAKQKFEDAKSEADFAGAADAFAKVALEAPWVGDNYLNLGIALEKAGKPKDAIADLRLYLRATPQADDAKKIRMRIGKLRAIAEGAAAEAGSDGPQPVPPEQDASAPQPAPEGQDSAALTMPPSPTAALPAVPRPAFTGTPEEISAQMQRDVEEVKRQVASDAAQPMPDHVAAPHVVVQSVSMNLEPGEVPLLILKRQRPGGKNADLVVVGLRNSGDADAEGVRVEVSVEGYAEPVNKSVTIKPGASATVGLTPSFKKEAYSLADPTPGSIRIQVFSPQGEVVFSKTNQVVLQAAKKHKPSPPNRSAP